MQRINFILVMGLLSLVGCSSDGEERPAYLDSHTLNDLEVPPRLSIPNTRAALRIPKPSARALEQLQSQNLVEGTVAPVFKDVKLKSSNGLYWLEINESPDQIWGKLQDFWANEGIRLVRNEPLLGILETEWLHNFTASHLRKEKGGWFSNFMKPDLKDRFRMRVERINRTSQSRIYVSHRGVEVQVDLDDRTSWLQRQPDPLLEQEILLRLMLFSGLSKAASEDLFAGYDAYHPRVRSLTTDGNAGYVLIGEQNLVWHRLIQALDRLGVEIKKQDQKQGRIELKVSNLDDHNGSDEEEVQPLDISLDLKASRRETVMKIMLANKQPVSEGVAGQFRDKLLLLLK